MALGHSSFKKVAMALGLERELIVSPYSGRYRHMHSLAHPIFYAIQFGIDIVKLLGGVVELIVSPLSFSGPVMADKLFGVGASLLALACDVLACAISVVSILTRTVASLGGYVTSGVRGRQCGGLNEETTMNMLTRWDASVIAAMDEDNCKYALPSFYVPNSFPGMRA